nr:MAG TPA: hypothetical protein [Caudoviricetes sp.]
MLYSHFYDIITVNFEYNNIFNKNIYFVEKGDTKNERK